MKALYLLPLLFLVSLAVPRSLSMVYGMPGLQFFQNLTMNASLGNISSIQSSLYLPDPEFYITGDNCGNLSFWNLTADNLSYQYQLPIAGIPNASNLSIICAMPNRSISNLISLESSGMFAFTAGTNLYLMNANTQKVIVLSMPANIADISYLRKRNWVAAGDSNGNLMMWDATTGTFIQKTSVPYGIVALESQYDSNFLMIGGWSNYLNVLNIESNHVMKGFNIAVNIRDIRDLRYTDLMAVCFTDNSMYIVNKHNWKVQRSYQFSQINSLTWDYHNNILAVGQQHSILGVNLTDYSIITMVTFNPEYVLAADLFSKANGYSYLLVLMPQKVMMFNYTTEHHPHASNSSFVINQTLLWNVTSMKLTTNLIHYHNDKYQHEYLISSDFNGNIYVLNVSTGGIIKIFNDPYGRPITCLIQVNNTNLIAYGVGKEVIVWDVELNQMYRNLTGHTNNVTVLLYIPDTDRLLSGSLDGFIKIWDISCCVKQSIYVSVTGILSLDYVEGTVNLLVLSYNDVNIQVWNMTSGTLIKCFDGGQKIQTDLINIPKTPYFLTSGTDNSTALRNKFTYETVRIFGFDQPINGFSFDSTLNLLLITSGNNVIIFDLDDFNMSTIYREPSLVSNGLFFYPYILQGPYYDFQNVSYCVLVDSTQNYLQSWNLTISWGNISDPNQTNTSSLLTLIQQVQKQKDQGLILTYDYSPSLQYLVTGDSKGNIKFWNSTGGNLIRVYKTNSDRVQALQVLEPDTLVAYTEQNTLKILDLNSFSVRNTLSDHLDNITSIAYIPGQKLIVSGSLDGTVRVWSLDNQAVRTTIYAFLSGVSQVVYNEYLGILICSGMSEQAIQVFQITGEKVYDFNHNVQSVTRMIDLGANFMAYIGFDGQVYLYDVNRQTPSKILQYDYTPNSLTFDEYHNTLVISTANQIFIYNLTSGTQSSVLNESLSWTFIASSFELVQETPYRFDTILIEETDNALKFWNVTYNDSKAFTPNSSNYYIQYSKSFVLEYPSDMLLYVSDGDKIVSGSRSNGVLEVFQPSTGAYNLIPVGATPISNLVLASKNGDFVAVSSNYRTYICSTLNYTVNLTFQCGNTLVTSLSYDYDRNFMIVGDNNGRVYFYDIKNQSCWSNQTFTAHINAVNALSYLGNHELLTSGTLDNTVKLWLLTNNTMLNSFVGPRSAVPINLLGAADDNSPVIGYLDSSNYLAAGGYGTVYVWNRDNSTIMRSYIMNSSVTTFQSIEDKNTIVVSTGDSIYFVNAYDYNLSLITSSINRSSFSAFLTYKNSSNGQNYLMMSNKQGAFGVYQIVHYNGDQSRNGEGGGSDESSNKAWIAGVVIGVLAAIIILGIIIACCIKKRKKKEEDYGGYKHFNDTQAQDKSSHAKPTSKPHSHKSSGRGEDQEKPKENEEENMA